MNAQTVQANVAELAAKFAGQRKERQRRTKLDQVDFEGLRQTGYPLLVVPEEFGGLWQDNARSVRPICEALHSLAMADSSLALVSSMHPSVVGIWVSTPDAPEPFTRAWQAQRGYVMDTVRAGDLWGTITSESGSGGDLFRTKAQARAAGTAGQYRLTGQKQFGSGTGIMAHMITTAIPEGDGQPDWFFKDFAGVALDGSAGVAVAAPWDGHGMAATQSHALTFTEFPATRFALHGNPLQLLAAGRGTGQCYFASVIAGIVQEALDTARADLSRRKSSLRHFELTEWAHWEREGWLLRQAREGMVRSVESGEGTRTDALMGKLSIADLAESVMTRICRVMGGGTFSRHSPFGFWFEDVRAEGFLRPSWSLATDNLVDAL